MPERPSYTISSISGMLRMSDQKILLLEGETDCRAINHHVVSIDLSVGIFIITSGDIDTPQIPAGGGRSKIIYAISQIAPNSPIDRILALVDREFDSFEIAGNDIVDQYHALPSAGGLVFTHGHSIENYLLSPEVLRVCVGNLSIKNNFSLLTQHIGDQFNIIITYCAVFSYLLNKNIIGRDALLELITLCDITISKTSISIDLIQIFDRIGLAEREKSVLLPDWIRLFDYFRERPELARNYSHGHFTLMFLLKYLESSFGAFSCSPVSFPWRGREDILFQQMLGSHKGPLGFPSQLLSFLATA